MRLFSIIPFLLFSVATLAQPANVTRVLSTFDFEERRLGNVEEIPMNWQKVTGDDLPHYVNGTLSSDRAHGGQYSFRFDLNGGGLIYRYPAGKIRVQPGAHYRVEGYVQTTVLPNARAKVTAYLADVDGHPLANTSVSSKGYAAKSDREGWQKISFELSAGAPNAAWLVLELALLQPSQIGESALGDRALFTQDIRGSAWFDDISISQVPKVILSTDRPGNIFLRSDPLRLQVLVNDRFTDDLSAQLVIKDAEGKTAFQRSGGTIGIGAAENIGPGQKRMTLELPDLPAGWYEASLVMSSQGQFVGKQTIDLIRLASDQANIAADPRFGIDATHLPVEGWSELPQLLPFLGAGRVKLAVWSAQGDIQQLDSPGFDKLLEKLGSLQITPTACLVDLPPDVACRLSAPTWIGLLKGDRAVWQPQLAYLIARHANHLDRWQLGADGSDAFVNQKEMRDVYKTIYAEFAKLVQKPDLAMPWPAWYDLDGELPATVALSVPPEVLPAQLPLYMQELHAHPEHNLSVSLVPVSREKYGREVEIRDLAQRFAYTLANNTDRIDLSLPFTVKTVDGQMEKQPLELFIVARTLMSTLSGAVFKGKVPLAEGVEAFLFERNGHGLLMMWDRGTNAGVKSIAVNLGPNPTQIDLYGNTTPIAAAGGIMGTRGTSVDSSVVPLQISAMPFFLTDVDGPVAQLRASVRFDNEKIESSFKEHTRHMRFENPYKQAIAGSVKLKAPAGWVINPPTFTFALNPGETLDRELTIQFPYSSFAGSKTVEAKFIVQADKTANFTVPMTLKLGLSDVGLQTLALRDGKDVIVQQMITNYGDKPIDYTSFAIFPGQARQERLVTNLGAGRTTIKKYRFANVPVNESGKVRSGVKELEGARVLNDEVAIQ